MPAGCKSILNVKCLHKSYIAELFGPWVKTKFGAILAIFNMTPRKTSIFSECCKKWPQQKNFFAEMWRMAKKNIWTDRNFSTRRAESFSTDEENF